MRHSSTQRILTAKGKAAGVVLTGYVAAACGAALLLMGLALWWQEGRIEALAEDLARAEVAGAQSQAAARSCAVSVRALESSALGAEERYRKAKGASERARREAERFVAELLSGDRVLSDPCLEASRLADDEISRRAARR